MILYVRRQRRHRCKKQNVGLCGRRWVWWFERMALKRVYYCMWNGLSVQVRCMRQGAQGQCTGMTLREGGARGVPDGEHMYTHGWFMSMYGKTNTICKVISFQLKKNVILKKTMNSEQSYSLNLLCFKDQIGWWSGYTDRHLVSFPFYRALYYMMFYIYNQKKISRLFKIWKWKKYP